MNALVICAATAPHPEYWLPQMAAAAQVVIAVDGGGDACVAAGVPVDHVVGDLDSLSDSARIALEDAGARFMRHPADKDRSDLDLALEFARSLGATQVTVTGAFRGRLDHTLVAVGSVARYPTLHPRLLEPGLEGWVLSHEGCDRVALGARVGRTVSVIALDGASSVTVVGVKWPLDHACLAALSDWGLSNVITDESASVECHEGTVLVTVTSLD